MSEENPSTESIGNLIPAWTNLGDLQSEVIDSEFPGVFYKGLTKMIESLQDIIVTRGNTLTKTERGYVDEAAKFFERMHKKMDKYYTER